MLLSLSFSSLGRVLCAVKLDLSQGFWEEVRQLNVPAGLNCLDQMPGYGWEAGARKEETFVVLCVCHSWGTLLGV